MNKTLDVNSPVHLYSTVEKLAEAWGISSSEAGLCMIRWCMENNHNLPAPPCNSKVCKPLEIKLPDSLYEDVKDLSVSWGFSLSDAGLYMIEWYLRNNHDIPGVFSYKDGNVRKNSL